LLMLLPYLQWLCPAAAAAAAAAVAAAAAAGCSVRLVALDGFTYNLKVGSVRHRLRLDDVRLHFGPAGPAAAEDPLDLRLRCIKVSLVPLQHDCSARGVRAVTGTVACCCPQFIGVCAESG
jgi:hypothetical protein